jgi:hypothetical protein
MPGFTDQAKSRPSARNKVLDTFRSLLRSSMAVTLTMLATGVLKPRTLMAANSASSSRCMDRMRSLTHLRRAARALFRVLHASRSASFSSPALAVASSSETASNSSVGKSPSSSAISTWREISSSELSSTSSVNSSTTVANGLPS